MTKISYNHKDQQKQIEAQELNSTQIKALNNPYRQKIIQKIANKPTYPARIAKELDISKQKCHYHFKKLQEAKLIHKQEQKNVKGGTANLYQLKKPAYTYIPNKNNGEQQKTLKTSQKVEQFLEPLINSKKQLNGKLVTGSPDKHGKDQVRARDTYLAGETMTKIGNYVETPNQRTTVLDTEINKKNNYEQNMIILGGILTNTVSRKYNHEFPAHFNDQEFPYREIQTPKNSYNQENIGIIAKTKHPENRHLRLFLIAGISNRGTEAACIAFKDLENILEEYDDQDQYYIIVEGLDIDGDGELDDYQTIETT